MQGRLRAHGVVGVLAEHPLQQFGKDGQAQDPVVGVGVQADGHRDAEVVLPADVEDPLGQEERIAGFHDEALTVLKEPLVVPEQGGRAAGEAHVLLLRPAVEVLHARTQVAQERVLGALVDPEGGP